MRTTLLILACLGFVLLALSPEPAYILAQADTALHVETEAIDITLGLGQSTSQSITLTNVSSSPIQPLLYEAYAPAELPQLTASQPLQVPLPQQQSRIDPELSALHADQKFAFLVFLHDQVDLGPARQIQDWNARGSYVYQVLHTHAEQRQQAIRADLKARGLRFQPLWIVNAILVEGQLTDVYAMAARNEVALVRANHVSTQPVPQKAGSEALPCNPEQPDSLVCWNIQTLGADRVWREFGITGQGIVVANNDSGAMYSHPALLGAYRGRQSDGSFIHDYSWFDPQGLLTEPSDINGHGTHTLGTMLGLGASAKQPAIGIAPGARWIAAQGCESSYCSESDLIMAAQWLLAPTDRYNQNPRPDLRPMIINNSWAGSANNSWYAGYTAAWRAAGIFAVFATGNSQQPATQICGSVGAPAEYSDVLAVGAVDQQDRIAPFSLFGATADGRIKPDFVAPGSSTAGRVGIYSSSNSVLTPYRFLQGTSMASPHVAGTVALLWSANPTLIGDDSATIDLLRKTAYPLYDMRCGGEQSGIPNNVYGYGRVDAFTAVAQARVDIPWLSFQQTDLGLSPGDVLALTLHIDAAKLPGPGRYQARVVVYPTLLSASPLIIPIHVTVIADTQAAVLEGQVLDAVTGAPLLARVAQQGGQAVQTNAEGRYTLTLVPDSYTIEISAAGYWKAYETMQLGTGSQKAIHRLQRLSASIQATFQAPKTALAFHQSIQADLIIRNVGQLPLQYQLDFPNNEYGVWRSDEGDGLAYAWVDLPETASILRLNENGTSQLLVIAQAVRIYDWSNNKLYINSNGTLSFAQPIASLEDSGRCMPDRAFPLYSIAPLRADFDSSRGGQIRYGMIDQGRTLVVSYENLVPRGADDSQRYSFQTLIGIDGSIIFQYRDIPALLGGMTAGIQHTPDHYQSLGCGPTLAIHGHSAITFFPQAVSKSWLLNELEQGTILPGAERRVPIILQWVRPGLRELRSQILITHNDVWQDSLAMPISLTTKPAPYEVVLVDIRKEMPETSTATPISLSGFLMRHRNVMPSISAGSFPVLDIRVPHEHVP